MAAVMDVSTKPGGESPRAAGSVEEVKDGWKLVLLWSGFGLSFTTFSLLPCILFVDKVVSYLL